LHYRQERHPAEWSFDARIGARKKLRGWNANRCDFRRSHVCSRRFIRCRFRSEPLRNDVAELSQVIFRARHEHQVCDGAEENPKPRNSEGCKTI
jgi:hypothetical protein